jgi:UDP-N-acetylmuramoyl-tripeptide--D-alanyl-D-alanine ligase
MHQWKMSLEELVAATQGRVVSQLERNFIGIGTDSRADLSGQIFFALKGDAFDAHDFLAQAVKANAAALVVHRLPPADVLKSLEGKTTLIEVGDTLIALQRLANFWRHKMTATILGITGTNGKTTTKEFAAAILETKFKVQYSKGSFNNHWGVPISLLSIEPDHEIAVIEMGMNHIGELKNLSAMVEADAVVCTMVGRGHLEGVGSIEGVAKAKAEIYIYAPKAATFIFNMDNEHTRAMAERFSKDKPTEKVLRFSEKGSWPDVDVQLEVTTAEAEMLHVRGQIQGQAGETSVPVFGRHNITNLMTAASFALFCGMTPAEIWLALPKCKTVWGRNQWVDLASGAKVLFDAYNANPESMRAAVENFSTLKKLKPTGRKIGIFGEMRELGTHAPTLHRELGQAVGRAGFDDVLFVGPSKAEFEAGLKDAGYSKTLFLSAAYEQNLASNSFPMLNDGDTVLIKGSRGMMLEKALADLKPLNFKAK